MGNDFVPRYFNDKNTTPTVYNKFINGLRGGKWVASPLTAGGTTGDVVDWWTQRLDAVTAALGKAAPKQNALLEPQLRTLLNDKPDKRFAKLSNADLLKSIATDLVAIQEDVDAAVKQLDPADPDTPDKRAAAAQWRDAAWVVGMTGLAAFDHGAKDGARTIEVARDLLASEQCDALADLTGEAPPDVQYGVGDSPGSYASVMFGLAPLTLDPNTLQPESKQWLYDTGLAAGQSTLDVAATMKDLAAQYDTVRNDSTSGGLASRKKLRNQMAGLGAIIAGELDASTAAEAAKTSLTKYFPETSKRLLAATIYTETMRGVLDVTPKGRGPHKTPAGAKALSDQANARAESIVTDERERERDPDGR